MGYEFSIILNREITDDESKILLENCTGTTLSTAPLPTNADLTGTQLEVDDTEAPTLAEAIQAALDAVKTVPDVLPASLTVPAQPNGEPPESETEEAGAEPPAVIQGTVETDTTDETTPTDDEETTPAGDGTAAASEPAPAVSETATAVTDAAAVVASDTATAVTDAAAVVASDTAPAPLAATSETMPTPPNGQTAPASETIPAAPAPATPAPAAPTATSEPAPASIQTAPAAADGEATPAATVASNSDSGG